MSSLFDKILAKCGQRDELHTDQITAVLQGLKDQGGTGAELASVLERADFDHSGAVNRTEFEAFFGIDYYRQKLEAYAACVDQLDAGALVVVDSLPAGWTKEPSQSRPGQFTYICAAKGIKVRTLEEMYKVVDKDAPVEQETPLPPGWKKVPSRSKPGEVRFFDPVMNVKTETLERAWEVYKGQQNSKTEHDAVHHEVRQKVKQQVAQEKAQAAQRTGSKKSHPEHVPDPGTDGKFVDTEFPPTIDSLGTPKPGRSFIDEARKQATRWVRLPTLVRMTLDLPDNAPVRFYGEEIVPNDLVQGQVGDCWLIASIAAIAEFPAQVRKLFLEVDKEGGRYVVQLYDMGKGAWEKVTVDDFIPCIYEEDYTDIPYVENEQGQLVYKWNDTHNPDGSSKIPMRWTPHFSKLAKNQMWALILEKAVAKFVGTFAGAAGGAEPYALIAFTGMPLCYNFVRPSLDDTDTSSKLGEWEWMGAQYLGRQLTGMNYAPVDEETPVLSDDALWEKLVSYDARNYLMCVCITKFKHPGTNQGMFRPDGLVFGHAYSLISCVAVPLARGGRVRLMQIRNPHGDGEVTKEGFFKTEWNGDWNDNSPMWTQHPEVRDAVDFSPGNDGLFWMSFEDFRKVYDKVNVLPRSMQQPRAEQAFRKRAEGKRKVGIALQAVANAETMKDVDLATKIFDPFASFPEFLDDGSFEKRLLWEASKPGQLQALIDMNKNNPTSQNFFLQKVKELGLEKALGPHGCI